jgi:hypothetical protein
MSFVRKNEDEMKEAIDIYEIEIRDSVMFQIDSVLTMNDSSNKRASE